MLTRSQLVSAPALPPIGLDPVKTFLRVDGSEEDALITSLINAATKRIEAEIDQKLVTQTWSVFLDCFPCKPKQNRFDDWFEGTRDGALSSFFEAIPVIKMPFGPLQSVISFTTYDDSGGEYSFSSSNYYVDTVTPNDPAIALKIGQTWPTTVLRFKNGIEIRGVFGYGDGYTSSNSTGDVPVDLQEAVKQMVGIMYEHRGDEMPKIPSTASMLLEPYRKVKV